jgi:lipid-A-disaccharide synthase
VAADFVGHPLADEIDFDNDRDAARERIGAQLDRPLIALLPGSRASEVGRLAEPFLGTARLLQDADRSLQFAIALANEKVRTIVEPALAKLNLREQPLLLHGRARDVLTAADVVLTASGTATLETLLLGRRMIVAHKIAPLTYWLVRRLGVARLPNFSLPNLLAGRRIVPEFIQGRVTPEVLGPAVLDVLQGKLIAPDWREQFRRIHAELRCNASQAAAASVVDLVHEAADGRRPS